MPIMLALTYVVIILALPYYRLCQMLTSCGCYVIADILRSLCRLTYFRYYSQCGHIMVTVIMSVLTCYGYCVNVDMLWLSCRCCHVVIITFKVKQG